MIRFDVPTSVVVSIEFKKHLTGRNPKAEAKPKPPLSGKQKRVAPARATRLAPARAISQPEKSGCESKCACVHHGTVKRECLTNDASGLHMQFLAEANTG